MKGPLTAQRRQMRGGCPAAHRRPEMPPIPSQPPPLTWRPRRTGTGYLTSHSSSEMVAGRRLDSSDATINAVEIPGTKQPGTQCPQWAEPLRVQKDANSLRTSRSSSKMTLDSHVPETPTYTSGLSSPPEFFFRKFSQSGATTLGEADFGLPDCR